MKVFNNCLLTLKGKVKRDCVATIFENQHSKPGILSVLEHQALVQGKNMVNPVSHPMIV